MSVLTEPPHPVELRERRLIGVSIGLVAAGAWTLLWLADDSAYGFLHSHHAMHDARPDVGQPGPGMLLFVAGWSVMTAAMMLPTALPLLAMLHAVVRTRSDRRVLVALAVAGYLSTWVLFGVPVYLARLAFERAAAGLPDASRWAWIGAPVLLLLAGAFQFTALKNRCLDRCRSPLGFVLRHWNERRPRRGAFRLGLENGLFCVGCCWALMLLMFAVGSGSLGWMLLLAAVMAAEKNLRNGQQLTVPVGAALILWAATLLVLGP